MVNYSPTGITVNKQTREMSLSWNDGHTSRYPFGLLRAGCPCASCRGGHENMSHTPPESAFEVNLPDSPETRLVNIVPMGSYALSFEWEDGHHFGIYTWAYLRALDPVLRGK
jgi:DUF971 family protein